MCAIGFLGLTRPQTPVLQKVGFSLASWTFLDDYGQGISVVGLAFTNGTTYDYAGWFYPYTNFTDLTYGNWFFNTSLVLFVGIYANSTYMGFTGWQNGLDLVRQSVNITIAGTSVFSLQNMTFDISLEEDIAPMYYYVFNTTISCFNYPAVYQVRVDYEIYTVS